MNKKKLEPLNYGVTKTEASYHIAMVELMNKLVEETRESNLLLKELLYHEKPLNPIDPYNKLHFTSQNFKIKPEMILQPRPNTQQQNYHTAQLELEQLQAKLQKHEEEKNQQRSNPSGIQGQQQAEMRKLMDVFTSNIKEITDTNKLLLSKLVEAQQHSKFIEAEPKVREEKDTSMQDMLMKLLNEKDKKRAYSNYGILSEIMPFSDKREIKVRFTINDLTVNEEPSLTVEKLKPKITEWLGMVFRATASICWNMLLNGSLNFEEVKVLFTQNIIFNYIQMMTELEDKISEDRMFQITDHINTLACEILEFLCRQYPQTKIEAPNIALKKAIPIIQNQGQLKYDLISMVLKESKLKENSSDEISFKLRQDKDYSSSIMKTLNFMIEKTEEQFGQFQKIMSNIFQQIYLPKEKRKINPMHEPASTNVNSSESQYREKVKAYSSYAIGRKIPKNTPKYTDMEIQYGVFFVKAPSILRIITKWVEELYEFIVKTQDREKSTTVELKNHNGGLINMSSRVKNLLFQRIYERLPKIQSKIDRIKKECYFMEFLLSGKEYIRDEKQMHLSEDQLCVGKFCSHLKNAISSYVCSQLSKLIYYTSLVPKETDQLVLQFNDEDFNEQARKHLDSVNLVSLKIFDLLRCKCHSNEEEIIWIVEALKQLQKNDKKFQLVRVKDRLNQGTRDILINAQYDGGLVWEIQLAVTSNVDKKQDLLDKYNHFLYELKRNKLGPISECVSIWSSLEQRSIYFQQLSLKKKIKSEMKQIVHKRKDCKTNPIEIFTQFNRPIICLNCKEYYSIPATSLLNVRCQNCRITYCGLCFYSCLSEMDKKKFMFQNFWLKKLLSKAAFQELVEYTDFKQPFPKQGFFIKKKFLNRELSYFTAVKMGVCQNDKDSCLISLAQMVIRQNEIACRMVHKKQIQVKIKNDQYFIEGSPGELNDFWFFHFPKRRAQMITVEQLEAELRSPEKFGCKYLNVLGEPNYMNEIHLIKKSFEKIKLMKSLREAEGINDYFIKVHRFNNFTVLAKLMMKDEKQLKATLIRKSNKRILKKYAQKKVEIVHLEEKELTNELHLLTKQISSDFGPYLANIQKLYLADNNIADISFLPQFSSLEVLSISKNYLTSLEGIESLTTLTYLKFDDNEVSSLLEVAGLVNLAYISGNHNNISSLAGLKTLNNLSTISLCSNKIDNVGQLAFNKALIRIYIRQNPLKNINPIQELPLKHLFIGQTQINPECLRDFSCISTLTQISLKGINLQSIPKIFDNMTSLHELKLNKNLIKKIQNISMLVLLTRLDLSENKIEKIENLEALVNLEELKLKSNKIKVVSGVKTFIQTLKRLSLEENPLDDVSQYLLYEEQTQNLMRMKYTQQSISEKAAAQIKNHSMQINNKSDGQD